MGQWRGRAAAAWDGVRLEPSFCGQCDAPMAQPTPDGGRMFVPAGALEGNPALRIAGHIFVGSKPDWVMICDDAPRFEVHADGSG